MSHRAIWKVSPRNNWRPIFCIMGIGIGLVISVTALQKFPTHPFLIWNGSGSAPAGLYVVQSGAPQRGDWVLVTPSPPVQKLILSRHYLPTGVPLIKQVRGRTGDVICRVGARITLNKVSVATALLTDSKGQVLPIWQGCHILQAGDFFLLNDHARSLDGRYFGMTKRREIISRIRLLWRVR
jgi:conjugative transfer signal peptidase TraF